MSNEIHVVAIDPTASPPGEAAKPAPKKKSGIAADPGEYLVMGELLRRGLEVQLADKNVREHQLLVGPAGSPAVRVQVRTVRLHPWPMARAMFEATPDQVTVYVLLGPVDSTRPARFFITRNRDVADQVEFPDGWSDIGSLMLNSLEPFENQWDKFRK